jgi:cell division septation protein DedD
MFGGSVSSTLPPSIKAINERNTIAPASEPQAASRSNAREVGPATTGSIDNRIVHEEQPTAVLSSKAAPQASLPQANAPEMPAAGQAAPKQAMPRVAVAMDPSSPPPSPSVLGSGYAVQVASVRSETGAQIAFRELQAKYPQLGGRQAIIRRADLGAAGIYYRALVGPFASAEKAAKLCSGLKAAGGDCVILKN